MSTRTLVSLFLLLALLAGAWLLLGEDDATPGPLRTIVLITPDTLRWDRVSAYAPEGKPDVRPQTPNIDRLAAEGVRFHDARTPVPLTLPAHTTMLTGLPPAVTGVRLNTYGRLPPPGSRGYPLLQERLQTEGWHTAAFVSAAVLGQRYGLDQGFDHYDDDLPAAPGSRLRVKERPGADTVAAALAHARSRPADERLFLWVHLFEPHAPYARDGTYAGDVSHCDEVVGGLLDGLAEIGRGDAAILLTSDHGEALGELREPTHGLLLADGVLRVPFLLRAPGLTPAVREDPVELGDVAATLAGLAGVSWTGPGLDLRRRTAPADRIRVAESLYAHHRFRWAQLIAAQRGGGTLVDAGGSRLYWLPADPWQTNLMRTALPVESPDIRDLANSIAKYKGNEKPDRIVAGQAAAGYGGGGLVVPFLPSERNGRLPDPYTSIGRALRLDQIKARLSDPRLRRNRRSLEESARALEKMGAPSLDRGSPELHFWLGEAFKLLTEISEGQERDETLDLAARAFTRAFELGRKDTQTLARASGITAALAGPGEALAQLDALSKQLTNPGCQYWILRIRLLRELGRDQEAEAACAEAQPVCDNPRDRPLWEETCR